MTLHPVTKILIGPTGTTLVDVSDWMDRAGYTPPVGDLGGIIGSGEAVLKDVASSVGTIPAVPRYGLEIAMRDSTDQLVFGGWIAEPIEHGPTGHRSWTLPCVPWSGRVAEASTGSLNKSGVVDSDRNFLIAMFLDALGASGQIFGADTVGADDPIVAANVAAGWPYVQATTQLAGTDWSYRTLLDVIHDLLDRVPETAIRIRPDKLVEYGVLRAEAPFVIAGHPTAGRMAEGDVAEIVAGTYAEEWLTAGHFNRVRLGGAGAAEVIAVDAVSLGRFGRVRNAPYENDEDLPAADVERAAYAKLASFAVRRIARATITDEGLEEGMVVRACLDELGAFEDSGPFVDQLSIYARTPEGEPTDGYRGEFVVQKVTPTFINEETQAYAIEMGAYRPDFERAIARQVSELRGATV